MRGEGLGVRVRVSRPLSSLRKRFIAVSTWLGLGLGLRIGWLGLGLGLGWLGLGLGLGWLGLGLGLGWLGLGLGLGLG